MLKIYIVDDEALIVEELRNLIDYEAYDYTICGYHTDPVKAREAILRLRPQLVICDVSMGKMTGFQLFDAIRSVLPDMKFCFLSAYDTFEYVQEAVRLGAIRYLKKPIRVHELISVLEEIKASIANDFNRRISAFLTNPSYAESDSALEALFRENPMLPQNAVHRIVAFTGEGASKASLTGICGYTRLLYADGRTSIYLAGEADLALLERYTSERKLSCGVSQEFYHYENISKHLRAARIASKEKFITGTDGFTVYRPNPRVAAVLAEIDKSRNTFELYAVIKNLEELLKQNQIKAYHLQKIYRNIIFNMIKFNIIGYDEKMAEISVLDSYQTLAEMIHALLENFEEKSKVDETGIKIVSDVISELEQNIEKRLTLSYFANKYNYNFSYFSQLFKKICGCSFTEYFINLKMNKAKLLIASTDLSLTRIALDVGYDDYYHFSKMFKKHTGYSPTDYRELVMKKRL